MIDVNQLREDLYYDRGTGFFFWKRAMKRITPGMRAGTLRKDGYMMVKYGQKIYRASRLAWFYETGEWPPPGFIVEQRSGNPSDNRWENLFLVTRSQNAQSAAERKYIRQLNVLL